MDDFYFVQTVSPEIINSVLVGFVIFLASVVCIALIAQYIFFGISIYKVAVLQGLSNPWMAWIPFVRSYLFGKIGDCSNQKDGRLYKRSVLLFILSFINAICSIIFIVLTINFTLDIINFVFGITRDVSLVSFLQMIDDDIIVNFIFTYFWDFILLLISFVFLLIFYIWFLIVNIKNYNLVYKEYDISCSTLFTVISVISYLFFLIFIPPLLLFVLIRKQLSISDV